MTAVFEKILEMSATAVPVILAVLLVRLLLMKAPKKYSYLLWSVVAFRLICPVSFRSAFSLLRVVEPIRGAGETAFVGVPATPEFPAVSAAPVTAMQPAVPAAPPAQTAAGGVHIMAVLSVIWCIGIAVILLMAAVNYIKVKRRLSNAVLLENNVWQADSVRSPLIVGIFRPRIFIPFGLDGNSLHYALAHERCHLRRFDHILRPGAYLILALHWFNPLCWLAYYLMVKDMEMSCDEAVLGSDPDGSRLYSTTLLSFAANKRFPAPNPLAFGETGVKLRIKNILNWKKPKVWVSTAAIVFCVAVLAACAADPKEEAPASTPGLKLGSGGSWVLANWYPDGSFDFNYDELNTLTVERTAEIIFEPDYPAAEGISAGEDLYIESGDSTVVQQKTISLTADENGVYRYSPDVGESAKQAVYFIPYEEGKFVIKLLFDDGETPAEETEETLRYTYSLPEYRGTTELDAEIWAALQPPEGGITNKWDIPQLYCGNRKLYKNEWNIGILDDASPVPESGQYFTDSEGLFEAMNISGWELIYDGNLHRYIDREGDKLITEETVYELSLYSLGLQLTFIEGTDICGYSIMHPEAGRAAKQGVARVPEGTAEALMNFLSPGLARAEYVELPYTLGFIRESEAVYSGPGGGVLVAVTMEQILVMVTDAALLDGKLWLRVQLPQFKSPDNDEGWLPAEKLVEYSEELAPLVMAPLRVEEGTECYDCADAADIPNTQGEKADYLKIVMIIEKKDGYSHVCGAGADEFWVNDADLQPTVMGGPAYERGGSAFG